MTADLSTTNDYEPDPDDGDYGEPIEFSLCPACGDPIDYCSGHGEIGDPQGLAVLEGHDEGDHAHCHPVGCGERRDWLIDHLAEGYAPSDHDGQRLGLEDMDTDALNAMHNDQHDAFADELTHDHGLLSDEGDEEE